MRKSISKLIFSVILITILIFSTSSTCFAASAVINQGVITIGKVSGNTGDEVIVPITIDENPGIMAITISVTYDSSALELVEDIAGNVIYSHEIKDHPSKNLIRLITLESLDRKNNGTLISFKFKIKPKTKVGLSVINIEYSSGDFCNWKLERIMPKIISGGVDVGLSLDNCPHENFSDWTVAATPTCEESGYDNRTCDFCGHTELRSNDPIGHEYSKDFTIDKIATEKESGLMSRHCIRCADYTDQISYSLKDSTDGNIKNEFGNTSPPNDYVNNLVAEQIVPEIDETESKIESETTDTSTDKPSEPTTSKPESQTVTDSENAVKMTVKNKILEAFPKGNAILTIFVIAIIILAVIVII